jgi:hypothetical protein
VLAFVAGLAAPTLLAISPAGAVTATIGEPAPPGTFAGGGCSGCTSFQVRTAATSPSYMVPPGQWTITSWSFRGGTSPGVAQLRVFRASGSNQYRFIAQSANESAQADAVPTFATSIPVQGRDVIGLRTAGSGEVAGIYSTGPGDAIWAAIGADPMVGQTIGTGGDIGHMEGPNLRVNVAATLEQPDPSTAPPDTVITKRPKDRTRKRKAKFKFEVAPAAAARQTVTFQCRLDNRPFEPCASPKTYSVKRGKHTFAVQAISDGVADPTPATDSWKRKKRRR